MVTSSDSLKEFHINLNHISVQFYDVNLPIQYAIIPKQKDFHNNQSVLGKKTHCHLNGSIIYRGETMSLLPILFSFGLLLPCGK